MEEAAKLSPSTDDSTQGDFDIVLAAEHLRSAANCLSRITGRGEASDVEEVLGVVFEKYASFSYESQSLQK
jgi:tRNA modification GTPase